MNPEEFDLVNVDPELLEAAAAALSSKDSKTSYPPSCDKGGGWEL
jgi:hypothetical protein